MSETVFVSTSLVNSFSSIVVNNCSIDSNCIAPVNNTFFNSSASDILTGFNNPSVIENHYSTLMASLYSNPQVPRNVVQTVVEGINIYYIYNYNYFYVFKFHLCLVPTV